MAISVEDIAKQLEECGILPGEVIRECLPPQAFPADGDELIRELVRRKKLTPFQGQQVHAGNAKSLSLGNYVISDKLGQGGMGMVYKASHRLMKREVALKVLPPAVVNDDNAVKRFLREVEAAAKLSHPHIVTAYDADRSGGTLYLIMEYVEGRDLAALVRQQGPTTVGQAVDFILQAARGLNHAHKHGVVHRDIKPANLLLDTHGTVKILDMGLARIDDNAADAAIQAGLTGTGTIMGTVDYMSPEQAEDTKRAGPQADIYSLGASLYYLLNAKPVVSGDTIGKKLKMLMTGVGLPTSLRATRADVPEALDAVFRKMTAHDVDARYKTMAEVVAELEGVKAGAVPVSLSSAVAAPAGVQPVAAGRSEDSAMASFLRRLDGATVTLSEQHSVTAGHAETLIQSSQDGTQPNLAPTQAMTTAPRSRRSHRLLIGGAMGTAVVLGGVFLGLRGGKDPSVPVKPVVTANADAPSAGRGDEEEQGASTGSAERGEIESVKASPPPAAVFPIDAAEARKLQQAWADYLGVSYEFTNTLGMKLLVIPPGEFLMGSSDAEHAELAQVDAKTAEFYSNERPQHRVRLTKPFAMGMYEVTRGEFRQFVEATQYVTEVERSAAGSDPQAGKGPAWNGDLGYANSDHHPVVMVSWKDAVAFCKWLTKKEGVRYSLPSEAQQEYACRGGTQDIWAGPEGTLEERMWMGGQFPHVVGQKGANPFGLYDLQSNVAEWCLDGFAPYSGAELVDPVSPSVGEYRHIRGGSYKVPKIHLRPAKRGWIDARLSPPDVGFRVVRELKVPTPAGAAPHPEDAALDLLPLVDLKRDALASDWREQDSGYVTEKHSVEALLRLPVVPGPEYALRAAFSTVRGNVSFVLPVDSQGLEVFLSSGRVELCVNSLNDPANPRGQLPSLVNDGRRHEILIEVARTESDLVLKLSVDGKLAMEWKGSGDELKKIRGRFPADNCIVVAGFLPVENTFLNLEEAEVGGREVRALRR